MNRLPLFVCLCLFLVSSARAEEAVIALWNGEELFDVSKVEERREQLLQFAREVKPDLLLLDEVCSLEVVEKVREVMELDGYHVACSDFNQRDDLQYNSFEVAILSRYPLTRVIEFDQSPDNGPYTDRGEPNELPLSAESMFKQGIQNAVVSRGFLWARIDALKLTLCLTHLKSSWGGGGAEADLRNAMKREYVAAAMAMSVLDDLKKFPGHSCLVAGDLNVGATDTKKNGVDLDIDSTSGEGDSYDETHALLSKGLVEGLRMKNLTLNVGETYDSTDFVGTGPIDNLYVAGPHADHFSEAVKTAQTFGSDHFAVWTVFNR